MQTKSENRHSFIWILLVLLLCLCLTGCRESPVLQQTIYQAEAPTVDENEEMLDPEDEGQPDEDFDKEEDQTAETPRDSEAEQGISQPQGEAEQALETEYNDNINNDWQNNEGTNLQPGSANETEQVGDDIESTPQPEDGGAGGKQIVDGAGRTVELPENVESVTAVGWAAQIIAMLDNSRIAAMDEDFLSSSLAAAVFDANDLGVSWPGDGSSSLSDEDFSRLLALSPSVCFEISGQHTFSEQQIAQLTEAGVPYVVLPALTSLDDLKLSVSLAGTVLGGAAAEKSAAYCSWLDNLMSQVSGKMQGNDFTSLYIAEWDDNASYMLNYTKGVITPDGQGLAVAWSPAQKELISDCMKKANIVNEATRIRSLHRDSTGLYVSPMFHQFDPSVSGNRGVYYSGSGEYGAAFDLFVARMVDNTTYYQLGSVNFPAVVVADESIKTALEQNWFWQYHETDGNGYITINGESFYCGIVGEYDIYVNPQGMCDWSKGSVEAPLETVWLAHKFADAYSLNEVKAITADFYQQFFGLELSDGQLLDMFKE